jgi:hypothetical protein
MHGVFSCGRFFDLPAGSGSWQGALASHMLTPLRLRNNGIAHPLGTAHPPGWRIRRDGASAAMAQLLGSLIRRDRTSAGIALPLGSYIAAAFLCLGVIVLHFESRRLMKNRTHADRMSADRYGSRMLS